MTAADSGAGNHYPVVRCACGWEPAAEIDNLAAYCQALLDHIKEADSHPNKPHLVLVRGGA